MKKIMLIGLIYDTNIGDKVIYDNTKYLVEKALKEIQETAIIESMDMTGATEKKDENSLEEKGIKSKIKHTKHTAM